MHRTPWWLILGWIGLGVCLGTLVGVFVLRDGSAPFPIPLATSVLILLVAAFIFWGGWQVRRIRKRQPARIGPLAAARVAVLAQSGSRGGALLFGAFAILAVLYNRSGSSDYVTAHVRAAAAAAVASAVLAFVGCLVESWCNVSGDDDGGGTDPIPREPHPGTAVRGKPSKQLENFPLGG